VAIAPIRGLITLERELHRNNNTNIGNNNEASGWDPVWILFHDDYDTNLKHGNYGCKTGIERRKSFYLYEYYVAPPRVVPGRVLP